MFKYLLVSELGGYNPISKSFFKLYGAPFWNYFRLSVNHDKLEDRQDEVCELFDGCAVTDWCSALNSLQFIYCVVLIRLSNSKISYQFIYRLAKRLNRALKLELALWYCECEWMRIYMKIRRRLALWWSRHQTPLLSQSQFTSQPQQKSYFNCMPARVLRWCGCDDDAHFTSLLFSLFSLVDEWVVLTIFRPFSCKYVEGRS